MFGIPNGIQVFLVLNFLLLAVFLYGFRRVLEGRRDGLVFSLLLAGGGISAFFIHGYFLLAGHPEFRLPVSLGLIGSTLVVSLAQGFLALKELRG